MATFTTESGGHTPDQWPLPQTNYQPINTSAGSQLSTLINTIKTRQAEGNYEDAQQIIDDNQQLLSQYVFDTSKINQYVEEIRNIQVYALQHKQQIYYGNINGIAIGDIYIGDNE